MPRYYKGKAEFRIIGPEKIGPYLEACPAPWAKALLALVYLSGARVTEALRVRNVDITVEGNDCLIKFITLKRGDDFPRVHIYSLEATPYLKDIILPYFQQHVGFDYTKRRAEQILHAINKKLSPQDTGEWITYHELRHSRNTYLARDLRATIWELRDWNGWKSSSMASTYVIPESSVRFRDRIK